MTGTVPERPSEGKRDSTGPSWLCVLRVLRTHTVTGGGGGGCWLCARWVKNYLMSSDIKLVKTRLYQFQLRIIEDPNSCFKFKYIWELIILFGISLFIFSHFGMTEYVNIVSEGTLLCVCLCVSVCGSSSA